MKCKDYYLNASFLSQEMITSKTVILNKFTFLYKKKVNQGTSQLLPTHKIEYLILQPVTLIQLRGPITRLSFRVHMQPCGCVNLILPCCYLIPYKQNVADYQSRRQHFSDRLEF
jgi:hypothetical protein